VSLLDASPAQLALHNTELSRLECEGALGKSKNPSWLSRMFLVPNPCTNNWMLIVDLRHLNMFCRDVPMKYETLKRMRNNSKQGNYMFSFDRADGYYTLGITSSDRDYFTVNVRGQLWRLADFPMGWNTSPHLFCTLMHQMVRLLRCPALAESSALRGPRQAARRNLRDTRWKGLRVLPFVDGFLFVTSSHSEALTLTARNVVDSLLTRLGLARNPKKGMWEPAPVTVHPGMETDLARGVSRAPAEKLTGIRDLARAILGIAGRNQRWIPAKMLAWFAGKAQFLYLAIPAARFYLRELHNVLSTKECWGARVKLTN